MIIKTLTEKIKITWSQIYKDFKKKSLKANNSHYLKALKRNIQYLKFK